MATNGKAKRWDASGHEYAELSRSAEATESALAPVSMRDTRRQKPRSKHDTSLRPRAALSNFSSVGEQFSIENQKIVFSSSRTAINGRGGSPIRKKNIGHRMSLFPAPLARGCCLGFARRTFALLHQQARQHGTSILFQPLVKQRIDFFAEICRVT